MKCNIDQSKIKLASSLVYETDLSFLFLIDSENDAVSIIKEIIQNNNKKFLILSSTDLNSFGFNSFTIDSFFGFNEDSESVWDFIHKDYYNTDKHDIIWNLELLIINNLSIISPDVIDNIDLILRENRRGVFDSINMSFNKPFAGIQIILISDLLNIKPINLSDPETVLRCNNLYITTPNFNSNSCFFDAQILSFYSRFNYFTISLSYDFESFLFNKKNIYTQELSNNIQYFSEKIIRKLPMTDILDFGKELKKLKKIEDITSNNCIVHTKVNYETFGLNYFNFAINCISHGELLQAFKYILAGYDSVTCDCSLWKLLEDNFQTIKNVLFVKDSSRLDDNKIEILFLKTLTYYYLKDYQNALKQIKMYKSHFEVNKESEEITYCKAIGNLFYARIIEKTSSSDVEIRDAYTDISYNFMSIYNNYFAANMIFCYANFCHYEPLKQSKYTNWANEKLIDLIIHNTSSICANRKLKEIYSEKKINIENHNVDGEIFIANEYYLINLFNSSTKEKFLETIKLLYEEGKLIADDGTIIYLHDAIQEYALGLIYDMARFKINLEKDDYGDISDYIDESTSFSQYGGAYGYDDDTINSAFDGDPENYWNID